MQAKSALEKYIEILVQGNRKDGDIQKLIIK
jgi:hypothetical protein